MEVREKARNIVQKANSYTDYIKKVMRFSGR